MSAAPGYLLILNVLRNRAGSEFDEQFLIETFKIMGAEIEVKHNPGGEDIRTIMHNLKTKDFTNYSYVAVAYLSHGTEDGYVLTAEPGEIMKAQKFILTPLCNVPSLDGKLKWLIMQTCRGPYDFIKEVSEGPPTTAIQYPRYCAKFFATTEGMKAYRHSTGSLFIKALCERLKKEYETNDIITIMKNTSEDVINECKASPKSFNVIQKPCSEDNFAKKKYYITSGFTDN